MFDNNRLTKQFVSKVINEFYNIPFPEDYIKEVLIIHSLIAPLYPAGCEGNLRAKKGFWLSKTFAYPLGIYNTVFQGDIKENLKDLILSLNDLESWTRNCCSVRRR